MLNIISELIRSAMTRPVALGLIYSLADDSDNPTFLIK
jgi:hypothetical protein